jgi:heterotetrameric sarcosine oxidase gamma subunit
MLEASSALASAKSYASENLKIEEAPDFSLVQYSGSEKDLKKALGKLPVIGVAQNGLMRVSPTQLLQLDRHSRESGNDGVGVFTTELSSSRTRIEISGAPARHLLAKCAAIDFHASAFKSGTFVMTGIHHVPVLIHCVEADTFHIYVMRTFALSIWDTITDAALEYA